jgi:glycosyltransferase involved in cell wall biosynthesis
LISVNDGAIDHIRDGANGLLLTNPTHADSLREVIHHALSQSEAARTAMGIAARETMLPLTWEAHLMKWMKAIDEVRE